jgi:hypothetical protein
MGITAEDHMMFQLASFGLAYCEPKPQKYLPISDWPYMKEGLRELTTRYLESKGFQVIPEGSSAKVFNPEKTRWMKIKEWYEACR